MIKIRRVEVEWNDSTQSHKIWQWPDEYLDERKKSKETFKNIGYMFHKDKKDTVLCGGLHYNEEGEMEKVGTIFTIPTGCVKKIKYL